MYYCNYDKVTFLNRYKGINSSEHLEAYFWLYLYRVVWSMSQDNAKDVAFEKEGYADFKGRLLDVCKLS